MLSTKNIAILHEIVDLTEQTEMVCELVAETSKDITDPGYLPYINCINVLMAANATVYTELNKMLQTISSENMESLS